MEYREIFRLMEMLTQEGIPFKFIDLHGQMLNGWQICYPSRTTDLVCSIVEHKYSYGNYADRLEIMGLLTAEEKANGDSVVGWLTAEDVFQRIKKHWEANKT